MCCGGKFCCCMDVRTGSLIFGWIHAILFGIGTLACFIINWIAIVELLQHGYGFESNFKIYLLSNVFLAFFGAGFTASVLLLIGIIQRKPMLIKGYIIYGMISTVMIFIVLTIFECLAFDELIDIIVIITEIFGSCIYCLILYLHYLTFNTMSATNGYVVPLEEF